MKNLVISSLQHAIHIAFIVKQILDWLKDWYKFWEQEITCCSQKAPVTCQYSLGLFQRSEKLAANSTVNSNKKTYLVLQSHWVKCYVVQSNNLKLFIHSWAHFKPWKLYKSSNSKAFKHLYTNWWSLVNCNLFWHLKVVKQMFVQVLHVFIYRFCSGSVDPHVLNELQGFLTHWLSNPVSMHIAMLFGKCGDTPCYPWCSLKIQNCSHWKAGTCQLYYILLDTDIKRYLISQKK